MDNQPNRGINDTVFDSLVEGVQSHKDRNQFLSVPEAAREEIVSLNVDEYFSDSEVGGATPSVEIDSAQSHNPLRQISMAAPIDEDHQHWKKLFFQNQRMISQLLKRPLEVDNTQEAPNAKKQKARVYFIALFHIMHPIHVCI